MQATARNAAIDGDADQRGADQRGADQLGAIGCGASSMRTQSPGRETLGP